MTETICIKDMARVLGITPKATIYRIKQLKMEYVFKDHNAKMYSFFDFERLKRFQKRSAKNENGLSEIYEIYPSKLNYLEL
jgi:hypothetical protein